MKLYALFILILSLFVSCSTNDANIFGGADDTPNSIKGVIVNSENSPVENALVVIESIRFTNTGLETVSQDSSQTNAFGEYAFTEIEKNNYRLLASFEETSKSINRLTIFQDSTVIPKITVLPNVTIKGRVINSTGVSVVTQGSQTVEADGNGFYTLSNISTGEHDLIFFSGEFYNILTINILSGTSQGDTIYIKDVELFEQPQSNYVFFDSFNTSTSIISHTEYEQGYEPSWYLGKNFDNVVYSEQMPENISLFNNAVGENIWHNKFSWIPNSVPLPDYTAIIENGVCIVNQPLGENTIIIEQNGKLHINNVVETGTGSLYLRGGELSFEYSQDNYFKFERDIFVEENSVVSVFGLSDKRVQPNQRLVGSANITKLGPAELHLECDASDFSGNWIVREGKLRVRFAGALGSGEVFVYPRTRLDNEDINGLESLERVTLLFDEELGGGIIELDKPTTLKELVIDGEVMPAGIYYEEFNSTYFRGSDTLTVLE